MRIVSRQIRSSLTSILVVEAGEEQPIGTILQEKSGIYKVEDIIGHTATKKMKSEAIEWLLVQAGYEMGNEGRDGL